MAKIMIEEKSHDKINDKTIKTINEKFDFFSVIFIVIIVISFFRETDLLHPIENKGEFFGLPLAHPDTLIMGSYSHLSPFSKQLDEIGAKYVYFENLTEEQKKFFKIPQAN
jgi:hypothetical protein